MPTEVIYGIILLTAIAAGALQTVTGFGAAVILLLVLSQFFDMLTGPATTTLVCLFLTMVLSWRYRKHIEFRLILTPLIPYLLTSTLISLFLDKIDLRILGVLFGVFLVLLSLYHLFLANRVKGRYTEAAGVVFGLVSGVMAGLFGIGGPLLAVYILGVSHSKESFTGNLQFVFFISNCVIFFTKLMKGFFSVSLLPLAAVGVAGVLLGQWIGGTWIEKLKPEKMKIIIYIFIGISGLITILQNVL